MPTRPEFTGTLADLQAKMAKLKDKNSTTLDMDPSQDPNTNLIIMKRDLFIILQDEERIRGAYDQIVFMDQDGGITIVCHNFDCIADKEWTYTAFGVFLEED